MSYLDLLKMPLNAEKPTVRVWHVGVAVLLLGFVLGALLL